MGDGFRRWAALLLFAGLLPTSNFGTTLISMDIGAKARNAVWIGLVRIRSIAESESRGFPVKVLNADILEIYKGEGQTGESISVEIPGGMRNQRRVSVIGMPQFQESRDYILFLRSRPELASNQKTGGYSSERAVLLDWSAYRVMERQGRKLVMEIGNTARARGRGKDMRIGHKKGRPQSYHVFMENLFREMN